MGTDRDARKRAGSARDVRVFLQCSSMHGRAVRALPKWAALCDMIRCEPRKVRLDRSKTRCARLALATMTLFLPNQIYAAGSRHGHFSHCVVFMVGGGDLRVVLC